MGIIFRQSFKTSIVSYIGVVLGAITTIFFFPKYFEPDQYGLTRVLSSFTMIVLQFCLLGTGFSIVRFLPRYKHDPFKVKVFMTIMLGVPMLTTVLSLFVITIYKSWIVSYFGEKSSLFVEYFGLVYIMIVAQAFFNIFDAYARSYLRIVIPVVLREVLLRVLIIVEIVCYVMHWIDFDQFLWLFVGNFILIGLLAFVYAQILQPIKFGLNWSVFTNQDYKDMGLYTFILAMGGSSLVFSANIDVLMVSSLMGLEHTAIYTVGFFIGTLIEMPKRAISKIAMPVVSASWVKNDVEQLKSIYVSTSLNQLIVACLLFILIWSSIDDLLKLIPNNELFVQGKYVIFYIGLSKIVAMSIGALNEILRSSNKYYFTTITILIFILLAVLSNYWLIPIWGIEGAAIATLLSVFIFNLSRYLFMWYQYKMQPFTYQTLQVILLSLAVYGSLQWFPSLGEGLIMNLVSIAVRSLLITITYLGLAYLFHISEELNEFVKSAWSLKWLKK